MIYQNHFHAVSSLVAACRCNFVSYCVNCCPFHACNNENVAKFIKINKIILLVLSWLERGVSSHSLCSVKSYFCYKEWPFLSSMDRKLRCKWSKDLVTILFMQETYRYKFPKQLSWFACTYGISTSTTCFSVASCNMRFIHKK